jgi:hypothetical protein
LLKILSRDLIVYKFILFQELCEDVTKAKEQKRKKQEEYNQVCKEFTDAYGIALSPGEPNRAVALDGTHFQVCTFYLLIYLILIENA